MTKNKTTRLNTVINVRENQKKQTTRELLHIRTEKNVQIEVLHKLHEEREEAFHSSFKKPYSKANEVQTHTAFLDRLSKDIKKQLKSVKKIEQQEDTKREELIDRVKAQDIVEKLKEKFLDKHRKENDRKEQKVSDTLGQRIAMGQQ